LEVRRRILGAFEMAETLPTAEERRQWLTFAVVGAGPTGVELAGQIRELAMRTVSQEFRRIDPAEARVLLFDGGDAVLASFGRQLSARAKKILDRLGVETHLGIVVSHVDGAGLDASTKDGAVTHYPARTVLWTAGVEAVSFVTTLAAAVGAEQDRAGRIKVKPDLTLPGCPNIWAVGDVISLDGLPGVAEVALQGGVHAGGQIHRLVTGKVRPAERFKYRDLGTAAYLCRFHAVIKVGPVRLSGFAGWLAWGFIHLAFLNGLRARAATLSTWMLTLARDRRSERAILYRASR
jgi:NADH dehydrogenase